MGLVNGSLSLQTLAVLSLHLSLVAPLLIGEGVISYSSLA